MRFNSPLVQVILVSFICFACPGMFNAVNSMGAGGQIGSKVGENANIALYTCFAIFGILAGAFLNIFGPRVTIVSGGITYVLYVGSLLTYNHTKNDGFVIFAGALLGVGAGLLWTAQGAIMMSYPEENQKGRYIGIFWTIFNMGGVLGGFLAFGLNFNSNIAKMNDGTYIAFMVIMFVGSLLGLFLARPESIVRDDGSKCHIQKFADWRQEGREVLKLFTNRQMLLLTPMFIASNWFYSYQFGPFNGALFNSRTQAFNSVWYWGSQMVGAQAMGYFLDNQKMSKKNRAVFGLFINIVCFSAVWGAGLKAQLDHEDNFDANSIDFTHSGAYSPLVILYLFYGLMDATLQTWSYWIMGSLSNDSTTLSRYAGYYKGIQSAGAACAWAISSKSVSGLNQLIICWAILLVAAPSAYIIAREITDLNSDAVSEHTKKEFEA